MKALNVCIPFSPAAVPLAAAFALAPSLRANAQTNIVVQATKVQVASSAGLQPSAAVTFAIDAALASADLRHATCGVYVRSLQSGTVLYAKNEETSLVPASCNKLMTVSTALTKLGPDFVYHTTLYRIGTVDAAGVLTGDLILRGSGDPSFSADDLLTLARALNASGVKAIKGRILADDSRFDSARLGVGWTEDDDPFDYQAEISALNCDENVVAVEAAPAAAAGQPALVTLKSGTSYAAIANSAITTESQSGAAGRTRIGFDRARAANTLLVTGTIPMGAKPVAAALTIEDPALFAATRLAEILPGCGVAVPTGADLKIGHGVTPVDAVVVATKDSAPLGTLVTHLLKESDNLYAETLLKTVAAEKGTVGSAGEGVRIVRDFLKDAGVDVSGVNQVDGCGLSRSDIVTPRALVDLLTFVGQKSSAAVRSAFESALPVAGVDGTLRRRMKNTAAEGKVMAKTGSLNRVSSLVGFVTTRSGERLVFAILMNNYSGGAAVAHTAQDKIAALLAGL